MLDSRDLDGRTAVITGGGRGIGLACAQALSATGADITRHLVEVTDPDGVDACADRIARAGVEVDVVVAPRMWSRHADS